MNGSGQIRFSDLFWNTMRTCGYRWTRAYYLKRGMSLEEFEFWLIRYDWPHGYSCPMFC